MGLMVDMFKSRSQGLGMVRMGVKHLMSSESKSLCGRQVTQGTGVDCKNCARVKASKDAWAGEPAGDMVAVEDVEPLYPVGYRVIDGAGETLTVIQAAGSMRALQDELGFVTSYTTAEITANLGAVWLAQDAPQSPDLGNVMLPATEVQATQVARATVAVIDVAAREAFELAKIDAVELPADPFRGHPDYAGEDWQVPYESLPKATYACADEVWHGTNTCLAHPDKVTKPRVMVKAPIRTCLGRRKRKATKRARKAAQGFAAYLMGGK